MKKNFLIFVLTVYITSCSPVNPQSTISPSPEVIPIDTSALPPSEMPPLTTLNGCIPPIVISGYQQGEGISTPIPTSDILPAGWDEVSQIPEKFKDGITYIGLIRPRSGYEEFWIGVHNPSEFTNINDIFLVYRTDTQEWRESPPVPGFNFFLDKDQNVWVVGYSQNNVKPRLYRLDDNSGQFISVMDGTNELDAGQIVSNIKIDSNGLFWFIFRNADDTTASNESLYEFNPLTLDIKHYLSGMSMVNDLEIDLKDNLYILQGTGTLVYYQRATNETLQTNLPRDSQLGIGGNLYIDHQNRLWVSDRLWFELSKDFFARPYIMIRSPIFIDYIGNLSHYEWIRPSVILETIDGRLWYTSARGNAWFKPDTGEWCLFTTHGSRIVEDSDHNLWMLIENTLYKLNLTP